MTDQDNLTAKQNDLAIFLPAISSFYSSYIGRQRTSAYVDAARMPAGMPNMESMNWLNPQQGLFPYRWSLYSAGHANLDLAKADPKEDMIRNRDPGSIILADSGGFQIAKGVWPGRWADPTDRDAERRRAQVLEWQMGIATYGMTMDIPTWTFRDPKAAAASGIHSYDDAVRATEYNNNYWIANRYGSTKILNVLQGGNHAEADHWYDTMKGFCDPAQHSNHFNGWGMGGQNMCDAHLVLKRIVTLIHDGLLEPGVHDWMHFLGTSRLEWAVFLTAVQRAVRRYHNPQFTISFDCASPFLATANGQLYHSILTPQRGKWSYQMAPTADDKRYATDSRSFGDAVRQDRIHPDFEDSPISQRLKISDVCIYRGGVRKTDAELNGDQFDFANPDHYHVVPDLNKVGKIGRTSWDSFSYALLMGHNVWMHLESVQRANRCFDQGIAPSMLLHPTDPDLDAAKLIDRIFAARDRQRSLQLINDYAKIWERIVGTRGFTGKRSISARPQFDLLFDTDDAAETEEEFDQARLDELENSI